MNSDLAPSRLLTIVFICFLLMGCGGSEVSNITDTTKNKLKVMTYNILHAQPMDEDYIDFDAIVQVINDADLDLVALQEVNTDTERSGSGNQAPVLAEKLGMYYFFAKAIDYGVENTDWAFCQSIQF